MKWSQQDLINLLDTIQEGVFVIDKNHRITFFNHAAEVIFSIGKIDALGQHCWDVLRADCCGNTCLLKKTLATGELFSERIVTIISAKGVSKPLSIATTLLRDSHNQVSGAIETFRDLSSENLHGFVYSNRFCNNIITINNHMQKIIGTLPMIAGSDSTVLIQGESGTGKELFAHAIHDLSSRNEKAFIAVNCGALPDNLFESELFGYKAGAFTDAKKDKPGRFALAEGGCIFLDEIGDLSQAMQVKLLRVIQEKEYEPLGGIQCIKSNVRVVTATNRNLFEMVHQMQFRKDLYYRLNVISITIPPLRDRKEDIPLLVDYYITKLNKKQNKQIRGVADDTMTLLMAYDYPGNVRELENTLEHAFVLCSKGYIQQKHLPETFCKTGIFENEKVNIKSLKKVEKVLVLNVLVKRNGWNRQKTAMELGINRSSLYRKMKALGIHDHTKIRMNNKDKL